MTPARLKHLADAVEARPQILKGIGAAGITDRRTLTHIENTIEVGVDEHRPARQGFFTVIDTITVGIIPNPATDARVIVLNHHIQIRYRDASVVGINTAHHVLDRGGVGSFSERIVDSCNNNALGCVPVLGGKNEIKKIQCHLTSWDTQDNPYIGRGLSAQGEAVGVGISTLRHQSVHTCLSDQNTGR